MVERTYAQVFAYPGPLPDQRLPNYEQHRYRLYRQMRLDPTIALGRALITAPLVVAGWTYEADDDAPEGAKDFVECELEKWRTLLMKTAIEGYIDYGWQGYERVYRVDSNLQIVIGKIKPLLHRYTEILVDPKHGAFLGLRQFATNEMDLYNDECFIIALDVEGTNWYGRALMQNCIEPYEKWSRVEEAAARYDKKIAGSHWVVHFPEGESEINGVATDNGKIADSILKTLQSSGAVAVPVQNVLYGDPTLGQAQDAWKIELISPGGTQQAGFTERQRYLDGLKVRGLGLPERSVLEGKFGTKAEAEAHGDFAIVNMEMRHWLICEQITKVLCNDLLSLNYGIEAIGTVTVKPTPLNDATVQTLKETYLGLLKDPGLLAQEAASIDFEQMRTRLDIPARAVLPVTEDSAQDGLLSDYFRNDLQDVGEVYSNQQPSTNGVY